MKNIQNEVCSSVPVATSKTSVQFKIENAAKVNVTEQHENDSGGKCGGLQKLQKVNDFLNSCEEASKNKSQVPHTVQELDKKDEEERKLGKTVSEPNDVETMKKKLKPKEPPVNIFWMDKTREDHPMIPIPRPPKTVEIRGGDVVGACECIKRNGLQQDCPKDACKGSELCLAWPSPRCQPSGLGAPIIVESRLKKPDAAHCEVTSSDLLKTEKSTAEKRRKEEVRLIEQAREGWTAGKQSAKAQKQAIVDKGYLKCKIHSSMYRLVPLQKSKKTQTHCDEEAVKENPTTE